MGPLIDDWAVAKMEEHVQDALSKGGQLVPGGRRSEPGSTFFEPTVMTGITQAVKVAKEETFVPPAPITRFKTKPM
jgi:succinate-semialdehyde dehydrogenase/glutarate-semialdehyde dehydrogenase